MYIEVKSIVARTKLKIRKNDIISTFGPDNLRWII